MLDGLGTLHYQWQRDSGTGFVNVGLDQATYTLGDADVGGTVRVVVSYTDGHGTAETVDQRGDRGGANVNDAPTGAVAVTGTATEDQVLTADTSTLADADGLGTLHYQWQRDSGAGFVNVGARPGDLHAGRCRRRRHRPRGGQLHRRPRHGRDRRPAQRPQRSTNVNDAPTGGGSGQRARRPRTRC